MLFIHTAQNSGFKAYGIANADNLDHLKEKLTKAGDRVVHLIEVNPWDGTWTSGKCVPVDKLSEADVEWLEAAHASSERYLECSL